MPNSAAAVSNPAEPPTPRPSASLNPPLRAIKRNSKDDTVVVLGRDGHKHHMDLAAIDQIVHWACAGVSGVEPSRVIKRCRESLHNGMKATDVGAALVQATTPLIETESGYSHVCARLLLDSLWTEASSSLGLQTAHGGDFRAAQYPGLFKAGIHSGVELGLLPENLLAFDLERLALALDPLRDKWFAYPRLSHLYEHELLHFEGTRLELPQSYFMRLAMGQALVADDCNARAIEYYQQLSRLAGLKDELQDALPG